MRTLRSAGKVVRLKADTTLVLVPLHGELDCHRRIVSLVSLEPQPGAAAGVSWSRPARPPGVVTASRTRGKLRASRQHVTSEMSLVSTGQSILDRRAERPAERDTCCRDWLQSGPPKVAILRSMGGGSA